MILIMRVEPQEIIKQVQKGVTVSTISNDLGIHKTTIYRWMRRARCAYGKNRYKYKGLKRKSTARKTRVYVLSNEERILIEELRESTGYHAKKIKVLLHLDCSWMTIHRYLKRRGHIDRQTRHKRPRFQDTKHMHIRNTDRVGYLQMDVKYLTPELTGLPHTCFEYGVIDIYSRYKDVVILNHLDQEGAITALRTIISRLPFKAVFVQTDNGFEFSRRFTEAVEALGMKHHHIHKRSPNENGVIERSFRTDQEELLFRLKRAPQNYDEFRALFDDYLYQYNYKRPHFGLNLKTPAEVADVV